MNIMWDLRRSAHGNDFTYVSTHVAHTEDENMDEENLLNEDKI